MVSHFDNPAPLQIMVLRNPVLGEVVLRILPGGQFMYVQAVHYCPGPGSGWFFLENM